MTSSTISPEALDLKTVEAFDLTTDGPPALALANTIREFESRLPVTRKKDSSGVHSSVSRDGAIAVGVSRVLRTTDNIASNHRGHAHCIAKGANLGRMLAEILGRRDGYCSGKGGSMHIGVKELGILEQTESSEPESAWPLGSSRSPDATDR